ncbi:MAG TPA: hypothetical protein VG496_18765 [Myxococcales bacterium]|nr:hypothetical protein [Myxococcales bacterium]
MVKQLITIGNSQGLILDRAVLQLLGLEPNGAVELRVNGDELILRRAMSTTHAVRARKAGERVVKRLNKTLKRLADS